jgi:hypothetical protein
MERVVNEISNLSRLFISLWAIFRTQFCVQILCSYLEMYIQNTRVYVILASLEVPKTIDTEWDNIVAIHEKTSKTF